MRLQFISDTHTYHRKVNISKCDILICSGDIMSCGYKKEELLDFNSWVGDLLAAGTIKKCILVAGNHDRYLENHPKESRLLLSNIYYLMDQSISFGGIKFYGSPWQPFFYNWAFNVHSAFRRREIWGKIPHDTDVLITHCPPHSILDPVQRPFGAVENVGCEELFNALKKLKSKPKIHAFGHIHGGYGTLLKAGSLFVNASSCCEEYRPTQPPILVDYNLKTGVIAVVKP